MQWERLAAFGDARKEAVDFSLHKGKGKGKEKGKQKDNGKNKIKYE